MRNASTIKQPKRRALFSTLHPCRQSSVGGQLLVLWWCTHGWAPMGFACPASIQLHFPLGNLPSPWPDKSTHAYAYTHMHINMHTRAFADKPMPYAWVSQCISLPWPGERHGNHVRPITLPQSWDPNPHACRVSAWALTLTAGGGTRVLRVLRIPGRAEAQAADSPPPFPPLTPEFPFNSLGLRICIFMCF